MNNFSQASFRKFKQHLIDGAGRLGIQVSEVQAEMMECHAKRLLLWNKKINITAIKDPLAMAEKHFVDSLTASSLFSSGQMIMDMGSGGGFPGVVLKIMDPSLQIVLVDSSRKKISFLKEIIRTLEFDNITAIHARVEDLQTDCHYINQFDAVVSRAFSELSAFVSFAIPFIKPSGRICAMKGKLSRKETNKIILHQFNIQTHMHELPFEKSERHILSLTLK